MKTGVEIRCEAWKALWQEGWLRRFFAVMALYWLATLGVTLLTQTLFADNALEAFLTALLEGDFADEEALVAFLTSQKDALRRLAILFAWSLFASLVLRGVFALAFARLELRAARHVPDEAGWMKGLFTGFRMPLALCWLWLCQQVRTWWVAGLFVLPPLVLFEAGLAVGTFRPALLIPLPLIAFSLRAFYRYRQAWFLKAAHEDWPARRCLAASAHLTEGAKMRNFRLDCAYWRAITLLIAVWALLAFASRLLPLVLPVALFVPIYVGVGQAIFHRELLARTLRQATAPCHEDDHLI